MIPLSAMLASWGLVGPTPADPSAADGELYVANTSRTAGTASSDTRGLTGDVRVRVQQRVLGAESACLSMVADDTDERQHGPFAYVEVSADATCDTLLAPPWPVDALQEP